MKLYLIHDGNGNYYPNKHATWTKNPGNAKKYVSKSAMLKRIVRLMEENPKTEMFYFEVFEMVSRGSTTLTNYNRNKKIERIRNYYGSD